MVLYFNTSPEKRLSVFISAVVLCIFISNIVAGLPQLFGSNIPMISVFLKVILGIMFALRLNIIIYRINKHIIFFILISLIVVLICLLCFPSNNAFFVNTAVYYFSFCLTTYIAIYCIQDYDLLLSELTKVSYLIGVILCIFIICIFSGIIGSFNEGKYSMGLGYSCIIPAIIISIDTIKQRKAFNIVFIAIFLIAIISFGSRGPLIELILFLLYFAIRFLIGKRKYLQTIFVVVPSFLVLINYKLILSSLSDYLACIGIKSRVIKTLTTDTIFLSGRDELYKQLIPEIKEYPFNIRGINAEWNVLGVYAHNFIIELLYQLGIIIGGIIIFFIIIRIVQTIMLKGLDSKNTLCIVFMFSCIPQLFVSGSLWTNYVFWFWMAMCSVVFFPKRGWYAFYKRIKV